ncbi:MULTISPECIES: L,D-transpeptidase [Burkholderia]|uniref:L,D-transpeptidase n=1 Tax=Burkholderia theae TaxID=3143496 RepID=A0ABU9WNH0_9BURK|nr:L,D-transpeptidase [Burkholderia sp. Z1]
MTNRYTAERGMPSVPMCGRSTITLRFDGRVLTVSGGLSRVYPGVSGQPDGKGRFDYSVERQQKSNGGPIPAGHYWVQPSQVWTNHWYNVTPRDGWGDHRLTIHVLPGTQTYGRGGFFIHGGTHPGSAGCINLHAGMEKFVTEIESALADSPDCFLPLTVQY